mgnify:CR=1 FL=1
MTQPKDHTEKRAENKTGSIDSLDLSGLLEPRILEAANRLGMKLAILKITMFSNSARFAEQLGLEPGDEVIIAYNQQEYSTYKTLIETLKMRGVTVHAFVSLKIPPDFFVFGVKKKKLQ